MIKKTWIPKEEQLLLINDYKNDVPTKELQKKYNIQYETISIILELNNVEPRQIKRQYEQRKQRNKYNKLNKDDETKIIKSQENGISIREISIDMKISIALVYKVLKNNGVEMKRGKKPTTRKWKTPKQTEKVKEIEKFKPIKSVCKMLQTHHARMEDDPERLDTKFMLKLIKGK
jgi:hypothetical protein